MATTATGARRPTFSKMIYLQRIQAFDHDQTNDYFPDFRQSFPKQSRVTRTFLYSEKHFQASESTLQKIIICVYSWVFLSLHFQKQKERERLSHR
jgi:hypothetical protein